MTARYICCRCDTRAESSVGHHLCEAPSDIELGNAVAQALALDARSVVGPDGQFAGMHYGKGTAFGGYIVPADEVWPRSTDACHRDLAPEALARGYRWTLSSVGDGTEYRATFERSLGHPAPSAIDRTPARAFARARMRTIEAAQRAAEAA